MILEELIAEAGRRGLRVNNLFERLCGLWQANLRDRDDKAFHEFGVGGTAAEALAKALEKVPERAAVTAPVVADDPFGEDPAPAAVAEEADPFGDAPAAAVVAPADEDPFA